MITEFITVNPELPYKEKNYLLWRRYMHQNGWVFLDDNEEIPKENLVFATGDQDEFLINMGFYVHKAFTDANGVLHNKGDWIHQNYPYGYAVVREPVIAWLQLADNDTYSKISLYTIIGNDLMSRMCGVRAIEG